MAKAKRKTHEVAKSYLKRWRSNENKLWMFDIENQEIEERSLQATFAIEDYLYVPIIEGVRDDSAEEWFSGAENELARFIERLTKNDFSTPLNQKKLFLTILGIMGLCHRSTYELRMIQNAIESDESLKSKLGISLDTEEERHHFSVENMVNIITQQTTLFCKGSISIGYGYNENLLVCDRPGFDMTVRGEGFNVIPLGPKDMMFMDLRGGGPPALIGGVRFIKSGSEQGIIHSVNSFTIQRARKWVVATSKDQLKNVALELSKDKVEQRKHTDKMVFTPLTEEERQRGWRLKKPGE